MPGIDFSRRYDVRVHALTLAQYLEVLEGITGYALELDPEQPIVYVASHVTRSWDVSTFAGHGQARLSVGANVALSTGSGGGDGGGDGREAGGAAVSYDHSDSPWDDLLANARTILRLDEAAAAPADALPVLDLALPSPDGGAGAGAAAPEGGRSWLVADRRLGLLRARGPAARIEQLDAWLSEQIRRGARQVLLAVAILDVTREAGDSEGLDLSLLYSKADERVRLAQRAPSGLSLGIPNGAWEVEAALEFGRWTLGAMVSQLAAQGEVTVRSDPVFTVVNGMTTFLGDGEEISFIANTDLVLGESSGNNVLSTEFEHIRVGFRIAVTPAGARRRLDPGRGRAGAVVDPLAERVPHRRVDHRAAQHRHPGAGHARDHAQRQADPARRADPEPLAGAGAPPALRALPVRRAGRRHPGAQQPRADDRDHADRGGDLMLPLHRPARFGGQQAVPGRRPGADAGAGGPSPRGWPRSRAPPGSCPLYVDQDRIDRLAAAHPALPLYGLWQTLIAAGRVPATPGRYRAEVDAQPAGARYLHRDGDGAHSGWLGGGARGDVFADAADADGCRELDCDPAGLALPAQPIQTRQHRLNQRSEARRRTLTALGLLAGAACSSARPRTACWNTATSSGWRRPTSPGRRCGSCSSACTGSAPAAGSSRSARRGRSTGCCCWPATLGRSRSRSPCSAATARGSPCCAASAPCPPPRPPACRSGAWRPVPMARFAWPGSAALRRRGLYAVGRRRRPRADPRRRAAPRPAAAGAGPRPARRPARPARRGPPPPAGAAAGAAGAFPDATPAQLARTLPGLEPIAAVRAEPDAAGAPRWPEHFGGEVWRAALAGPLLSVASLCRLAQPAIPLLVDSIEARDGRARAVVLVFGTAPAKEET